MTRLLLALAVMTGILAPVWAQDTVRINNTTKAVISPIPFRVGQSAVDPITPGNGSIWYDTATNKLEARINGVTVELGAASIITGADTQVTFFDGANNPAGDPGMTYNPTTNSLTLAGGLSLSGSGTFNGNTSFDGDIDMTPEGGVITIAPHTGGSGNINNIVIGNATPLAGTFTALATSGQFTSTLATGAAPFVVASTTNVANLNASSLNGATFGAPGAIGGTTPGSGAFTTLSATGTATAPVIRAAVHNHTIGPYNNMAFSALEPGATSAEMFFTTSGGLKVRSGYSFGWSNNSSAAEAALQTLLTSSVAATVQMGANAATGVNQTLKAMDASAGTGGNLTLAAGNGSTAGGTLDFQTSVTTTPVVNARIDASTTATHTRFFLYDVDNATLERVTVGAADSGGAGFKVLRIPN